MEKIVKEFLSNENENTHGWKLKNNNSLKNDQEITLIIDVDASEEEDEPYLTIKKDSDCSYVSKSFYLNINMKELVHE
jgi:hypothetical protein